jgi:putative ABC transport system permease protein
MFVLDNIKLATRNFKTRGLRTFLTVLGISVGIGTTMFLVSLGYGLQKILLEKIAKSDALLTLDVAPTNSSVINIDEKTIDEFSKIKNVTEVSPEKKISSQFKLDDVSSNVSLSSVSGNFFRLGGIELMQGKVFGGDKDAKVILSTGALTSLNITDISRAVGKQVDVTLIVPKDAQDSNDQSLMTEKEMVPLNQKFVICGIIDDSTESSGFIPIGWTKSNTADSFDEAKVKVTDRESLDSIRNEIVEKGFSVMALTDTVDEANKIFSIIQIVLAMFGIVALAVSAIGMFNTMTIALLERTNEIGILRAIGAARREILFLFLTESIIIGFLGGVGGIIIGFLGAGAVGFGFNILARALGGNPVEMFFTPAWFIIFIIVFSTLIGLVTGIYPALRASRLNPLVALRYK